VTSMQQPDADPQPVDRAWLDRLHTIASVEPDTQPEPFGIRLGADGSVVTGGNAVPDPVATAEALDRLLSDVGDDKGLDILEDARRMLHPVIVALETAQQERDQARAQVADYENRITWDTTCGQCATVLDRAIADYERAERAEAERDQARTAANAFTVFNRQAGCTDTELAAVLKAYSPETFADGLPAWVTPQRPRSDVEEWPR
jgi:hypothetical protein